MVQVFASEIDSEVCSTTCRHPDVMEPLLGQTLGTDGARAVSELFTTLADPSRARILHLLAIARENRVPIMGLNWRDDRSLALRWLEQLGNPYVSVAFDPEGRTAIDWGVYGAPETFLMDASGQVVKKHIGAITLDVWKREFLPLLPPAEGQR